MFEEVPTGEIEFLVSGVCADNLPEEARLQIGDKSVISVNVMVDGEKIIGEETRNESFKALLNLWLRYNKVISYEVLKAMYLHLVS